MGFFDDFLAGENRVPMAGTTTTTPSTGPFTGKTGAGRITSYEDYLEHERTKARAPETPPSPPMSREMWEAGMGGTGTMEWSPGGAGGYQPSAGGMQGDPQQTFLRIMGGLPATPENLTKKEAELKAAGIEVKRNAAGIAGKIGLSDGEIIDVVPSAGTGGGGSWQWLRGPDREGTAYLGGVPPDRRHLTGTGGGGGGGGVNYASRQGALEDTPGFKFRLDQGIQALDRSAASKGTLLSGGHLKELAGYASGLASQEYGAEWDRTMGLANLGINAAGAQNASGSSYGNQLADLTTGAGNATAAGQAASGQAWGNMWGNLGDLGMQYGIYDATRPPGTVPPAQSPWQHYPRVTPG